MATQKQVNAAKRNVKKAQAGARKKRSIADMPKQTRTALGKQGAAVAAGKRRWRIQPENPSRTLRRGQAQEPSGPFQNGPRRTRPRGRPPMTI